MYKYSASTSGLYLAEGGGELPDDCVDVTEEQFEHLRAAQASGLVIQADANGFPMALPAQEPVPQYVEMYQARAYLINIGRDDDVEAVIDAMPEGKGKKLARNAWNHARTVQRNGEVTLVIAAALGFDDDQMDAMFLAASKIV